MSATDPNRPRKQLPPIDPAAADALWHDYLTTADVTEVVTYTDVFHVGDHPELVDELLGPVLDDRKRATASGRLDIVYQPSP